MGAARGPSPAVLERMMDDGSFDAFRQRIVAELNSKEALKAETASMVADSKTLSAPGAAKMARKDLFEKLRKEIEEDVMAKASEAAWDILLSKDGIGKEITEKVESVLQAGGATSGGGA